MEKDSKFTRDDEGYVAVRTVVATEATPVAEPDSMFCRDTDGNVAIRVVNGAGGGGGDQHNKGFFATEEALVEAYPTAEDGDYAIVGSTDTVWIWDSGTSAWVDSDQKGQVTSVNGQTGDVVIADEIPSQTGNAGKFLTTNGTSVSWASATTTPATMPTLAVADWSSNTQTVNVTGVTATNTVIVSPAPASAADYSAAGILCTAQGAGTLTFTCDTVPSNAITVNVVILG